MTALPKVASVTCLELLRPMALTHAFGKTEDHVASLAMADIRHLFDHQLFGSLTARSTTLCMVYQIDVVLESMEQRNTMA